MAQFDPAAATAAYLALLPPDAHAKAQAYTHGAHWLLLWDAVISVGISLLVLRLAILPRVRDGVQKAGPRPWAAVALVALTYYFVEAVLTLPWSAYSDWWRDSQYGMTSQPFADWLSDYAKAGAINIVMTVILLSALYAVIRRAPRTWWLWGAGVTSLFLIVLYMLAPVYLQPLFNRFEPAPPGPVREAVQILAKQNGIPPDKIFIYNGSRQSNAYTAHVSGLFGSAQISMSDTMFAKGADIHEVRAVIGHEMGHYVMRHTLWATAGMSLLALSAFFLIDRLYPRATRWVGARRVGGVADPAGLPILSVLVTVLNLVSTPVQNAVSRQMEGAADRFSLTRVNEPDGLARALVKTIDYRAATPSRLEEAIFYSHPSVGGRIRRAMEWKARAAEPRP